MPTRNLQHRSGSQGGPKFFEPVDPESKPKAKENRRVLGWLEGGRVGRLLLERK